MGKHDHCCVPLCTSRRDDGQMRAFHHFPPPEQASFREQWILAIRRDLGDSFQISASTVVCSGHFIDDDYSGEAPPRTKEDREARRGKRSVYRLKPGVVPKFSKKERERALRVRRPPRVRDPASTVSLPRQTKRKLALSKEEEEIHLLKEQVSELQSELKATSERFQSEVDELKRARFSYENLRKQSESSGDSIFEFYTGLSLPAFDCLWDFIEASEGNILSSLSTGSVGGRGRKSTLSLHDQILFVLMRLRLGLLEKDLAFRFGVSESSVSRIFVKWINYLYLRLGLLPIWPSWENVQATMPECFKEAYPSTFIIIDATELFVEVPGSLSLQSQNYSSYKSHTTHKSLLGIAPNGCITFVSELFTGSISDRTLTQQSGILDLMKLVPPGKSVMADRGFEIQDLLVPAGLLLNIPPFRNASGTLSEANVKTTQQIARVRIHVERVIGQVKRTYRILQGMIPLTMEGTINQVWTVCCLLCNFKGPIINE